MISFENEKLLNEFLENFRKDEKHYHFKIICDETNNSEEDKINRKLNISIKFYPEEN